VAEADAAAQLQRVDDGEGVLSKALPCEVCAAWGKRGGPRAALVQRHDAEARAAQARAQRLVRARAQAVAMQQ
jgi:hypothetical protein